MRNGFKIGQFLAVCIVLLMTVGCSVANDKRKFESRPHMPLSVSLVGVGTGHIYWEKDIPVFHDLSVDINYFSGLDKLGAEAFHSNNGKRQQTMIWHMYDRSAVGNKKRTGRSNRKYRTNVKRRMIKGFVKLDGAPVMWVMKKRDSPEFPENFKFAGETAVADEASKEVVEDGGLLGDVITTPEEAEAEKVVEPKEVVEPREMTPAVKVVKPAVVESVVPGLRKTSDIKIPKFRSNRRRRIWMKEHGLDPDAVEERIEKAAPKKVEEKGVAVKKPEALPVVKIEVLSEKAGQPRLFYSTTVSPQDVSLVAKEGGKVYFTYSVAEGNHIQMTLFRRGDAVGARDDEDVVRMAWDVFDSGTKAKVKSGSVTLPGKGLVSFKTKVR